MTGPDGGVLALIPARGGSKGLPGKNTTPLAGRPLLWHSVACARLLPDVVRVVVSTDDDGIAAAAAEAGAEVLRRPPELAQDDTPMAPVVRHATEALITGEAAPWAVLLLDPTSPLREPGRITDAIADLRADASLDGVISVSEPTFRPTWVGVREAGGVLERFFPEATGVIRRQDAERYLRINGNFYVWRTEFTRALRSSWFDEGRHLGVEIPERLAFSIDDQFELDLVVAVLSQGIVDLPWLA